ncbi:MAG: FecR family protein [Archangium sp.]|nr:FecR family protein [Archangium sp.]
MSAHLTSAQLAALAVEGEAPEHLGHCPACRAQLESYRAALQALRSAEPPPDAPFARSKRIAHALAAVEQAQLEAPPWFRLRYLWLAAAVPVVLVALGVLWSRSGREVLELGKTHPSALAVGSPQVLEVHERTVVALGDGSRIEAQPGTRFEIVSAARVVLTVGSIQLFVEKRPSQPLWVETEEAQVRVVGTIFTVSRAPERGTRVEVREGTVEVTGPGFEARQVTGGQAFDAPAAVTPSPSAAPVRRDAVRATAPKRSRSVDVERVRSRVRAGQFDEARALLASERALAQSQVDAAELDIVEAEMLLATGRRAEAITTYLAVSERHGALRQGEAALFAAAQLCVSSDRPRAVELLRRSLERYPEGSFQKEVRDLLAVIQP